ncbi:hypothetical protein R8Z57_15870 [Microbacterium sp. M3]|uniref:DUF3566 domain-containing protein n=1 Tax=Microbacterium arthrosphaerae TaxID=792652 RepID=A0ABU4H4I9_9MICO|nr:MULTISPECIES: hypothetical protein [Microbacterium]MDW4574258.1 hypothetical protein [Microbacterium arthrosphaerae]MDW7608113.1 hypothetical protein [Microbacterium sp. M3]
MNRKSKVSLRELRRRGRKEYLTTSAVVVSIVVGLIGIALVILSVYLLLSSMAYLIGGGDPFVTVGGSRRTPLWLAIMGTVVGIAGGGSLALTCGGYLYRCATGQVIRLSPEELKKHRQRLAERERRLRAGG